MEEILLGVDYGEKNTGLAFGRNGLTSPLHVIQSGDVNVVKAEIARIVLENKVSKIIVGLPLDKDGKDTPQARIVRRFAKILKIHLKRPVEFVDEAGSSKEAVEEAIKSGLSQKSRRKDHHLAAALLLKRYYREKEEQQ